MIFIRLVGSPNFVVFSHQDSPEYISTPANPASKLLRNLANA